MFEFDCESSPASPLIVMFFPLEIATVSVITLCATGNDDLYHTSYILIQSYMTSTRCLYFTGS